MAHDPPRPPTWPRQPDGRPRTHPPLEGPSLRRCTPEDMGLRMRLVAQFGRFAADCPDVQPLLDETCCVAAAGLASEFAKLLVYRDDEHGFVMQAGTGWRDGLVGHARLPADTGTAAGFAWHTGESVVSNDIVAEGRFRVPAILTEHGIGSSINVVVPGSGPDADGDAEDAEDRDAEDADLPDVGLQAGGLQAGALHAGDAAGGLLRGRGDARQAFGVLEVEAPGRGDFTADDVCFLQVITHSLAGALARQTTRGRHEARGRRDARRHQAALREMHHRVRNDLQGICSGLDWEARHAGAAHRESFGRVIGRVFALAELYDQLLGADSADEVEFGAYLRALCGRIAAAGGLAARSIALRVEAQALMLPRDRALPLAVALNELVSNAAKHAFAGAGTIRVGLATGPAGTPVLSVGDDGRGFAGPRPGGAGLGFVERLVRQAGGTLAREDGGGTLWRIALPARGGA